MFYDVLQGKTLVALGDSLIYGSKLGPGATWVNKMEKYGMTVYNYGVCGNTMAKQELEVQKHPPMCVRYREMQDGADYVVVLGGANDKRLNVPIGEDDSRDISTFKGALNILIEGLYEKYPKAKFLFLTNYNRWPSKNALGISDIAYVDAMKEICAKHAVPCFDNYRQSGISFGNKALLPWVDEGLVLGGAENHHFSEEAYDWLLPKYAAMLAGL